MERRWEGADVLAARYPHDDGSLSPSLAQAMERYAADEATFPALVRELQTARLLVPIVAVPDEVAHTDTGLAIDKSSHMATVTVTGVDGRRALLAFTHLDSLRAWGLASGHPGVRPAPVPAHEAAQAALAEGADVLMLDLGQRCAVVVQGADLQGLAHGWQLAQLPEGTAWIRPT